MNGLALSNGNHDLIINPPWMNSSGMLGFTPDASHLFEIDQLGAFVSHPISDRPRKPAKETYLEDFPGGTLLHTGFPNPGISRAIQRFRAQWELSKKPVILHIIVSQTQEMHSIVDKLERAGSSIGALEIGLAPQMTPAQITDILDIAALSQLPILVRFSLDCDEGVIEAMDSTDVNALVIGPPRGSFFSKSGEYRTGRLYGPGLNPLANTRLERILQITNHPVIQGCGLYKASDIKTAFDLGAAAVQLDTMLWLRPSIVFEELNPRGETTRSAKNLKELD